MKSAARRRSFGVFTVSQTPSWRKPRELPSAASSGKRALLVVALLRQPLERLGAEHVDAGVDPVVEQRRLAEARHAAVVLERDDAERRAHLRDDDRRGGARLRSCSASERARSRRRAARRRSARARRPRRAARDAASRSPPPRPSGSGSPTASISAPSPPSAFDERLFLARAARDDHARHAGGDEARDAVLREREAGDRDERLRQSLRRLAEPLRLAAREQQRLHQRWSSGSRAAPARPATRAAGGRCPRRRSRPPASRPGRAGSGRR